MNMAEIDSKLLVGSVMLPAVAGGITGDYAATLTVEGYGHQSMSHGTMKYGEMLDPAARYAMNIMGLSPNRFALWHRYHHATGQVEESNLIGSLGYVYKAAQGTDDLTLPRELITLPGRPIEADPLLYEDEAGDLQFRQTNLLEEFVARGGWRRPTPFALCVLGLAQVNKKLGLEHPYVAAISFSAGFVGGLTGRIVYTAAAEARAGMHGGDIDETKLDGLERYAIDLHEDHHARPFDFEAGSAPRQIKFWRWLAKHNLIEIPELPPHLKDKSARVVDN